MISPREEKSTTRDRAVVAGPLPSRVYIPLSQHTGKLCTALVKVGDAVRTGQRIGSSDAKVYAPVHASVSGKVLAIDDWPHPVLGRCKAVVIESDASDAVGLSPPELKTPCLDSLRPQEIRRAVLEAGVVGMGGAGFPTHLKLAPPKPVDALIVNGAECEPYVTCDFRLMVEKTNELCAGIELAAKALGVSQVYVAIEDNKPEAIETIKAHSARFKIRVIKSGYPQGGERQLISHILHREIPRGRLPFDVGAIVHNVATVYAIYEAVVLHKPLYERVVTVTGSLLAEPKNILARIGTPIKELVEYCGPLKGEPAKIIVGGPMMGNAQYTDRVPVIKTTTAVVLMDQQEARDVEEQYCIRCGACVRSCPAGLMPCLINLASDKSLWTQAKAYAAADCIECGLCNYVCPANRRLTQSIRRAKFEVNK